MSATTLLLGAALDALSLALYFAAGRLVKRALPDHEGRAVDAFALFWYGVGVVNGLQALLAGYAAFADPGLALGLAVWNTRIALALLGFAGLVYYLLYVYLGDARIAWPISGFYVTAFLLMQAWMFLSVPTAATVDAWRVGIAYEEEIGGPLYTTVVLMFFLPPLLAAGAYALLLRHVHGKAQRRRVRLMSASVGLYFLGLTAGYLNLGWAWWGLVENLIGIGAALGVLLALRAPSPDASEEAPGVEA